MAHYPITGVASAEPYPRKNIINLPDDPLEWNLLLEAFTRLQAEGEDLHSPLGFYQIAGIHGVPFVQWMEKPDPDDRPGNYCTHGTALFLTWHRPYLLLLEQRLVQKALEVTQGFSAKYQGDYQAAALRIRLPYWDWATDSDIPAVVRYEKTEITLPEAGSDDPPVTRVTHNPWYSYQFQSILRRQRDFSVLQEDILVKWEESKRCPDKAGNSRPDVADAQLRHPKQPEPRLPTDYRDGVYKLLRLVSSYGAFSNTGWQPKMVHGPDNISIESYHNSIHDYIGSDFGAKDLILGHMTEVPVSSFDPIFCHSNIDRIYALWQAIHYKSSFEDQSADVTRLPFTGMTDEDGTTLRPFYFTQDKLWTNSMVQKTSQDPGPTVFDYNYYYPELDPALRGQGDQEKMAVHVLAEVDRLYGPASHLPSFADKPKIPDPSLPGVIKHARYRREWLIFLTVRKYLITGNFSIFFFFGDSPDEPHKWIKSPNRVGVFNTFKSSTDICANCLGQAEADQKMVGGADVTNYLYNALAASGIDPDLDDQEGVVKWLSENLDWKIRKDDGTEYNYKELATVPGSLSIGVASFVMAYPTDAYSDHMPSFIGVPIFNHKVHHVVTAPKKRKGGL